MPYNGQLFIWTGQNNVHLFDYLGLKNKQTGGGGGDNNNNNVPNKPRLTSTETMRLIRDGNFTFTETKRLIRDRNLSPQKL